MALRRWPGVRSQRSAARQPKQLLPQRSVGELKRMRMPFVEVAEVVLASAASKALAAPQLHGVKVSFFFKRIIAQARAGRTS